MCDISRERLDDSFILFVDYDFFIRFRDDYFILENINEFFIFGELHNFDSSNFFFILSKISGLPTMLLAIILLFLSYLGPYFELGYSNILFVI